MADDSGFYKTKPEEDSSAAASSNSLNQSEQSFYHRSTANKTLDKQGLNKAEAKQTPSSRGLYALAGATPWGKALRLLAKHKKGAAVGGGGATGLILGIVLLFGFVAAHELQTIKQDMMRYEDKAFSYVEKKAANKILQRMACRSASISTSGCGSIKESEASDEATKATDPMTEEIDKFSFTDPKVVESLANQDIQVNSEGGKFTGLTDLGTGKPITASDFDNPDMINRFQTAIPEWDVGQESTFRPLMTTELSSTFDVITSPQEEDTNKAVEDSIRGDITTQDLANATAEDENKTPTQNPPPTEQALPTDPALTGADNGILQTVDKGILKGETETQILSDVEKSTNFTAATAPMIASDICTVREAATTASGKRIPMIVSFLTRHSTTLISLADEMKVGGMMSGRQISKVTSLFNGDPTANPNSIDTTIAHSSLPFDRSAAWQRVIGNSPNTNSRSSGYNPDISSSLRPSLVAGSYVINDLNRILNIATLGTGKFGCGLVQNSLISGLLSVGQIVAGGFSFELSTAVIAGIGISTQLYLQHQVIPEIVKYFTPIGIAGLENSVQWMNNADAGSNLAMNMYAQRMGSKPLSSASATALNNKGSYLLELAQQHQSFVDRTFSFSNPGSLMSTLLVKLPLSKMGIINSFFREIINSPLALLHAFAGLVEGPKAYAAAQSNPGQAYGITQYGFDDSEINKYDPINNEYYLLHTTVTYKDKSGTLISLLGNPNDYPNGSDDLTQKDILHCFTQVYSVGALNETSPDPICGSMGNFDSAIAPTLIGTSQIATSFCLQLAPTEPKCLPYMLKLIGGSYPDLITHFRQYILDDEVTGYYSSLMSIQ